MPYAVVARVALGVVLLCSALGASDPPASTTAADGQGAGTACADGWRSIPLPDAAIRAQPLEIVVQDGRLTWLLGGDKGGPLILRRKGDGWTRLKAAPGEAQAGAPVELRDASPRRDGSLWTVGSARPIPRTVQPYAGTLQDADWRDRSPDDAPGDRVVLAGVAAKGRDRAWAVGTQLDRGRTRAYALQWDGAAWRQRDPDLDPRESGLTSVAVTGGGQTWAVGWATEPSGRLRPLTLRLRGGRWQETPILDLPQGSAVLTGLAFASGNDGWAAGYVIPAGSSLHRPVVLHWDGDGWDATLIEVADDASVIPRSIAVAPDGGIWMAGTWLSLEDVDPSAVVLQREAGADGRWVVHRDLPSTEGHSEGFAIAVADDGAYVAGSADRRAFLLRTCQEGAASGEPALVPEAAEARASSAGSPVAAGSFLPVAGVRRLAEPVPPSGFRVRDVTREAGIDLPDVENEWGLAADLDDDGYEDLFIWSHAADHHVLLGGMDGFTEGRAEAFGHVDRHRCSAADADGDGALDVFCTAGRARGSGIDRHELSLRPGYEDGGVEPSLAGIEDPFGRGRATTFIQLDDDGWPDLFIANAPDRVDALPGTNRLFRNVEGRFVAAPEAGLDTSVGGWCAVAADIDVDGDEDLLVCQEVSDDERDAGLRVHVNTGGRLTERSRRIGIEPMDDIEAIVADMTGDGRPDIVQLSRQRLRISRGTRSGEFRPVFEVRTPSATGMAAGDADGDGLLDLYVVAGSRRGNKPDLLLVNDGRARSFTSVRIPQIRAGSGADVIAIDHDDNGLADFVVLNGLDERSGPVKLLASYRTR